MPRDENLNSGRLSTHIYGGDHPLVGVPCLLLYQRLRDNKAVLASAVPYGAYKVNGRIKLVIIHYSEPDKQSYSMSGVDPNDLIPVAHESIRARHIFHKVFAGMADAKKE